MSHRLRGHPTLRKLGLWQGLLDDPTLKASHGYYLMNHAHQVWLCKGNSPLPPSPGTRYWLLSWLCLCYLLKVKQVKKLKEMREKKTTNVFEKNKMN